MTAVRKLRKADETDKKVKQAKQWRDAALEKGRKTGAEKRKREALAHPLPAEKKERAAARAPAEDGAGKGGKRQRAEGANARAL